MRNFQCDITDYKKLYIQKCKELELLKIEIDLLKKDTEIIHKKNEILDNVVTIIQQEKNKQNICDIIWKESPFKLINELKNNNVGNVGEKFLQFICETCEIESTIDGSRSRCSGGDGTIKNKIIEVKTSRQGNTKTFQHELGEHPWTSDYIILIDFKPECIYLSIISNFTEEKYKQPKRNALPYFNKTITKRKETNKDNTNGSFKLTLTEKDLISCKNTIKISTDKTKNNISNFINYIIN